MYSRSGGISLVRNFLSVMSQIQCLCVCAHTCMCVGECVRTLCVHVRRKTDIELCRYVPLCCISCRFVQPRWTGNSIAINCDISLKTFLQTLKHSKQSHKCILHEIPPFLHLPETWPTMKLRPTLAISDISSFPAFLPPTAAPIQSESQRPNIMDPNSLSCSDGKDTAHLWKKSFLPFT